VPRATVVDMSNYFDLDDELDGYLSWDDDDEPAPPLNLDPGQREALAAAVTAGLQERGCDHSLRAAREWAAGAGVAWPALQVALEGNGGYCDCEVLLNVLPPDDPEPDGPC